MGQVGKLTALAVLLTGISCGGRSDLLEPFQSETLGGSGYGAGGAGGRAFGGKGGSASYAGTFSTGGKISGGGVPSISGSSGVAGSGEAGEPSVCLLPLADCATPQDRECAGERSACTGSVAWYGRFDSSQGAYVNDVSVGRDRTVAVTGYHVGVTTIGGRELTSPPSSSQAYGQQAFLAAFDAQGATKAVYADTHPGEANGMSVELTSGGDFLLQTNHVYSMTTGASLMRLTAQGQERWREDWGVADHVKVTGLAVDNDDRAWSSGSFDGALGYPGITLDAASRSGYALQVDGSGQLLRSFAITPRDWRSSEALAVAVDDEDNVIVVGRGDAVDPALSGFLRKFSPSGEPVFEKPYASSLNVTSVVVDRLMRVTVFGWFLGSFTNEGQLFDSEGLANPWLAQYSREGALLWQKSYDGDAVVDAAGVDPFGNLLVVGYASRLVVGSRQLSSAHAAELGYPDLGYVLKLRADGTDIWAMAMDGRVRFTAVAANDTGQVFLAGSFFHRVWLNGAPLIGSPTNAGLLVSVMP